jgi:chemotaxis response regulator CheB
MIRVLLVEDSATMRHHLRESLAADPELRVVGEATDGGAAVEMVARLRPDVVTMDMMLPTMSGLAATEHIMAEFPTPILVVSSADRQELFSTYNALAADPELVIVGEAVDGGQAVELCGRLRPDVVTMDITMPHMDGIECVERLVEIKPDVLILVVSALADKATAVEAMEKGANGFLNKPFTDRQLNDALEELLSRR